MDKDELRRIVQNMEERGRARRAEERRWTRGQNELIEQFQREHEKNYGRRVDHVFNKTLDEIREAIINKEIIQGIDIAEEIKNPDYRFMSNSAPGPSLQLSQLLSIVQTRVSKIAPEIIAKGREQAKNNADKFAINMHETVQQIRHEEKITTYRATVDALNKKEIPTRTGNGKWYLKSLQNLEERWKKLGLDSPFQKPEQP